MAYICPYCKQEEQSPRTVTVKYCLNCKRIEECNDVLKFLRKIGVQEEVVNKVRDSLAANCL